MLFRVFRAFIFVIAILVTIFSVLAIWLIVNPQLIPTLAKSFTGSGITVATIVLAVGTFWLVCATTLSIHNQNEQAKSDKKQRLLHGIRDWIFEIKNVSLIPITEDNIAFIQPNVSQRYGMAFSKVEYFENAVWKIFRDADFKDEVSKIGEMLAAVMVFDRARYLSGIITTKDFEAFPGYTSLRDQLLNEYEEKQVELQNTTKEKSRIQSEATNFLWDKYVRNLSDAETILLSKLTDMESRLC